MRIRDAFKVSVLPFVWLLAAFTVLSLYERDYLWTAQEHNLFLSTPLYFSQCMVVSGGLLSWAGAWLTQLFYYPVAGAAVLCGLWGLLMLLLRRAFNIPARWTVLTLIPIAMLLIADTSLGYWLYFMKLRGHFFAATLGVMSVALLFWLYRLLPHRKWLRLLFMVVAGVVGYPFLGFYALLAVLVMGVSRYEVRGARYENSSVPDAAAESDLSPLSSFPTYRRLPVAFLLSPLKRESDLAARTSHLVLRKLFSLLVIVLVPLFFYHTVYYQTPFSNIYWTALPVFVHNGVSDTWQYAPYAVTVLWLITAPFLSRLGKKGGTDRVGGLSWTVVLILSLAVVLCWNKDANFHRELAMRRALEQQDWAAMLAQAKATRGEPTRAVCMMKNLALQRTGRLMKDQGSYPDGFCRPRSPFPIHAVHTVGKALYLQFGLPNYCYRWCMEDGVEYGWTAEELKLMVKCSLLNGETMAAQRYLSLLKKTLFHRQWAQRYQAYVRQPRLMINDAEFKAIFPLLRDDDFLTSDQSQLELFLIEQLASSPGRTAEQRELAAFCYRMYMNRFKYVEKQ